MDSNKVMAPAMMDSGVTASCNPKIMAPVVKTGSACKYANRIMNIIPAAAGKEVVVGKGFGLMVA